jgi:hypothetical protein
MNEAKIRKDDSGAPLGNRPHAEELLDTSLADTFPASDPVSLITPICSIGGDQPFGRRAHQARRASSARPNAIN